MTAELKRRSWAVNHKHVYRWMRAVNLLCMRQFQRGQTVPRMTSFVCTIRWAQPRCR
ncbi:MAG: hypothetical protein LAO04_12615 [Acidobacteriia bacterium]|nr:hypothetical protein [Terriglobia bacterium]